MAAKQSPSRQKLIQAALALFTAQGITETTTRQIAEQAGVNEVTLFRQFGNKHGLLLSAIEETEVFAQLAQALAQDSARMGSLEQALREYGDVRLAALEAMPEFVRSLVGESGQYPPENRQSLGRELTLANRSVAQYLATAMQQDLLPTTLPNVLAPEALASLLNSLLLGYAVLEFTSEFHQLWDSREDFLNQMVSLFLRGAVQERGDRLSDSEHGSAEPVAIAANSLAADVPVADVPVADLPASVVHDIFRQAKTDGPQALALIYVLFGSGLSAAEVVQLRRRDYQGDRNQHVLQLPQDPSRLVPLNQWILGKRYGAPNKNPLSQWLRSRKDDHPALFLADDRPWTMADLEACWQRCTLGSDLKRLKLLPSDALIGLDQARQTWCIEMLMRGMTSENLTLLTGMTQAELAPYFQRARVKRAMEQAIALDRKSAGVGTTE
jgi:AcrR family transcriptional regulator